MIGREEAAVAAPQQPAVRPPQSFAAHGLFSVAVFAMVLLVTISLQARGNAYSSEFGAYPDEPAHYITGLMIRDYIAAGFPASPVAYAENYYLHYPKVAFGMWGPLFHITEAAWTLVFPPSRIVMMALMAAISALTATLLYRTLVSETGRLLALMASLLFVCLPTVQTYTGMIMADGLVALLDFCAALAFGRYLNTGEMKDSARFGMFATLSILTKGNGVALVLLPLFAMLFSGKFSLLKRRSFWIGPALILFIAGPWQYYSSRMLLGILARKPGWAFFPLYAEAIAAMFGLALLPVVAIGLYDRLIVPARNHSLEGKWSAAAALLCSVWAFYMLVPAASFESRYLIAVAPPLLMFLAAGLGWIAARVRLPRVGPHYRTCAAIVVALALFFATAFSIPRKLYYGFDEVAGLLARPEYHDTVALITSEGEGEGMLISEVAMRDQRPSHIILRASKMMGHADWNGDHYEPVFHAPEELLAWMKGVPVGIVVIHDQPGPIANPNHELMKQTVAAYPMEFQDLGTFPRLRAAGAPSSRIEVYKVRAAAGGRKSKIRIDLPYTLGHPIER